MNSGHVLDTNREHNERLWSTVLEIEHTMVYFLEVFLLFFSIQAVRESPLNNSRLKNILKFVTSLSKERPSIPHIIGNLQTLIDLVINHRNDPTIGKSDCLVEGNWEHIVSLCHARSSDILGLEKQVAVLESELASQSFLVIEAVCWICRLKLIGKQIQGSYSPRKYKES